MATRAETETKPDALRREYAAWSKAQGLSLGIADEHIFDETLTEARRTWVQIQDDGKKLLGAGDGSEQKVVSPVCGHLASQNL